MKTLSLLSAVTVLVFTSFSQATKPANVYPSNLEENMYFEKFDAKSNEIKGLNFLVLSDGNNSKDKTPAFDVTLYLMPVGKTSAEDIIIVKVYPLEGIYHMGSHEFKNEIVSLSDFTITPGAYRLGVWVNSNAAFVEDSNDNATLFNGTINITSIQNKATENKKEVEKPQGEENPEEEEDQIQL